MRNAVHLGAQICGRKDVVQMHRVLYVECDGLRATLRTGPEGLSGRSLLIRREIEQQLADLIGILLLEVDTRPLDTVHEGLWSLVNQGSLEVKVLHYNKRIPVLRYNVEVTHLNRFQYFQWLHSRQLERTFDEGRIRNVLSGIGGRLFEDTLEHVTRPLQGVLNGIREVLQRTDRDRLLRGILRRAVRFRQEWYDNLKTRIINSFIA